MSYWICERKTEAGKGETKERELVHRDGDLHGTSHVWLVRYRPTGDLPTCCFRSGAPIRNSFPGCYDISFRGTYSGRTGFSGIGAAGASGRAGRKS